MRAERHPSDPGPAAAAQRQPIQTLHISKTFLLIAGAVIAWFLVSEGATEAWYQWKESRMPKTEPWGITFPQSDLSGWFNYAERELSDREKELLQFKTAKSASWRDSEGRNWTAFHLTWLQDQRLNDTDMAHNPTRCLPAIGLTLEEKLPAVEVRIKDTRLEFQAWRFGHQGSRVYAFLVNRREREPSALAYSETSNRAQRHLLRLRKVSEGNRSNPEEMLELVVQGARSDSEAAEALKLQVARLIPN